MLRRLDVLIRDVLVADLLAIVTDQQVRFQPPDATLRTDVVNLNQPALDVYLVDVREHRGLRSNERVRDVVDGMAFGERAPDRVDCHYLISAWSPAQPAPGVEPTLDEHALLYEVVAALMHHAPLNPAREYAANPARLATWPVRFQNHDLPTAVVPAEGFGKLAEFWSGMGTGSRWKPVVHLVVTLPVVALRDVEGPLVTTRLADFRLRDGTDLGELVMQIGGRVLRTVAGVDVPLAGAWVAIDTTAGVPLGRTTSDAAGRFTFAGLREGSYHLSTSAAGVGVLQNVLVAVPSPTGEYELRL